MSIVGIEMGSVLEWVKSCDIDHDKNVLISDAWVMMSLMAPTI